MSLRARLWLVGIAGFAVATVACVMTATSHHAELRGINCALVLGAP